MTAYPSWFSLAPTSSPLPEGTAELLGALGERLERLATPAVRPEHTFAVNLGEGALVAVVVYHRQPRWSVQVLLTPVGIQGGWAENELPVDEVDWDGPEALRLAHDVQDPMAAFSRVADCWRASCTPSWSCGSAGAPAA